LLDEYEAVWRGRIDRIGELFADDNDNDNDNDNQGAQR
jgi:hypothetical protein